MITGTIYISVYSTNNRIHTIIDHHLLINANSSRQPNNIIFRLGNTQNPFTYPFRTPQTYQLGYYQTTYNFNTKYICNSNITQTTYDHRSPFTYPFIGNSRQPSTYDHRSPFTYPYMQRSRTKH